MQKIKITSFPRIHLTLIGMNNDGYRINGGAGFSVSQPTINSCFEESANIEINDERELKFSMAENERLQNILIESKERFGLKKGIKCNIYGNVFPHYGLGSTTSIYLSCIEALLLLNQQNNDRQKIVSLSRRGGTSGVGINTYFEGGFVFDVGIKNDRQLLLPSSIAERRGETPLIINKCKLPAWKIGICIPNYIAHKSEQEEVKFFKDNCPIDKIYIENTLYESVYGITSSIIENNYEIFCKSVNNIQLTQWKHLERSLYGDELFQLENKIKELGADCVGMSSLGPVLFFFGNDIDNIVLKLNNTTPNIICYSAYLNNQERIINYD